MRKSPNSFLILVFSIFIAISAKAQALCESLFRDETNVSAEFALTEARAQKALGNRAISKALMSRIYAAHLVGRGEPGLDGSPAGPGNFTAAQIRAKYRILRENQTSETRLELNDIKMLFDQGVVGSYGNFGVSTSQATIAAAANRGVSNEYVQDFRELIARGAPHARILARYQSDIAEMEHAIATRAGGSPEWHLQNMKEMMVDYLRRREATTR